jgi:co-chaperonin GroES (HSP10)
MKFENYVPSWRNVIFHEVRPEKTTAGIYIPKADFAVSTFDTMDFNHEVKHKADKKIGDYVVLKVGKDCTDIKPGDRIVLEPGFMGQTIIFDEGAYLQVKEQQIAGYERS